ncbi:LacI family DNA-binding transcriptional regulator [Dethiothermospora halolimnae]|uniref:LacI family DNA-binding transcriptional regulator n=1 Tax=Dethiothermospora halolimnae TaxID=3114390 RepID=UPI003CCC32A0
MKKGKQVTASDVAQLAGVSISTVSRVISNNPKISEPTRLKVLECMDKLEYYPNANARSLAIKKTGTIGIVIPTTSEDYFSNPFFTESLRGIIKGASNLDYDLLVSTNTEKGEELKIIQKFIRGSKVDGIILMTSKINDECIEYLENIDFPFSLIGSTIEQDKRTNQVDNDNYSAAYELTKHILDNGRRNVAMIVGDMDLIVSKERVKGYKKALEDYNIGFDSKLLFSGSFDEKTGYYYGKKISKINPIPDGLIVTDDLVAFGAVKALHDMGVNIPKDIQVGSFNNSSLAEHSNIPLTSVEINASQLGKEAMKLLVDAIENETRGKKILVPYTIYKRKSTRR